ncbi:cache domain-containing protein [Veronia nyctiphanis]|uniref:cache domain-containing protein n=1 Tax=Veronia nyctiphanis TaxID=1278244 RepID=UPI001F4559BB|nr:cache domain-containing protein [Veronia nyctiphanis]
MMVAGATSWLGKSFASFRDSHGRPVLADMRDATRATGQGFSSYSFLNPASGKEGEKISALNYFAPWNILIGTGIYLDDIEHTVWISVRDSILFAIMVTTCLIALAFWLTRSLITPIRSIQSALAEVARGNLSVTAEVSSKDELGLIASDLNHTTSELRG